MKKQFFIKNDDLPNEEQEVNETGQGDDEEVPQAPSNPDAPD